MTISLFSLPAAAPALKTGSGHPSHLSGECTGQTANHRPTLAQVRGWFPNPYLCGALPFPSAWETDRLATRPLCGHRVHAWGLRPCHPPHLACPVTCPDEGWLSGSPFKGQKSHGTKGLRGGRAELDPSMSPEVTPK